MVVFFVGLSVVRNDARQTEALVREETPLSALWRSQEERGVTEANQRFVAANRRQSWATDIAKARQDGLEAGVTV